MPFPRPRLRRTVLVPVLLDRGREVAVDVLPAAATALTDGTWGEVRMLVTLTPAEFGAVAVMLDDLKVGYLPDDAAQALSPVIDGTEMPVRCHATLITGEHAPRVVLDVAY